MPEAPDLEVIKDFLKERATGAEITSCKVIKPSVLRSLCGELAADVQGRTVEEIQRRGKFLLIHLSSDRMLAINPMLTGAIQYCPTTEKVFKRTCISFSLSNGSDLSPHFPDEPRGCVVIR